MVNIFEMKRLKCMVVGETRRDRIRNERTNKRTGEEMVIMSY